MVQNQLLVHLMRLLILIIPVLLFMSCKKESPLDEVPEITFIRMFPDTVRANTDSIVVELSYADGDGDIGENNAYVKNLFFTDQRNQLTYGFRVSKIAEEGTPAIKGTLKVVMPYINLIQSPGPETTSFSIKLVDRAGHSSNLITSSALVITE